MLFKVFFVHSLFLLKHSFKLLISKGHLLRADPLFSILFTFVSFQKYLILSESEERFLKSPFFSSIY